MTPSSSVTAVVLAGGQGTRIRAHFPDVPKPMIPVRGRPFLYWLTAFIAHHGLRQFVYSTGYKSEQIEAWCRDGSMVGLDRRTCHEATPLGTGGGLLNCLDSCGDWALVANGDSLCLDGVKLLLDLAIGSEFIGGVIGVYQPDTSRYGSLDVDDRGRLRAFREKQQGQGYVNSGTYLFRTSALRRFRSGNACSIERDLIPQLLAEGAPMQAVLVRDAPFIDIGTPETVREADAFIRAHAEFFTWSAAS